jgi:hypothetical protein
MSLTLLGKGELFSGTLLKLEKDDEKERMTRALAGNWCEWGLVLTNLIPWLLLHFGKADVFSGDLQFVVEVGERMASRRDRAGWLVLWTVHYEVLVIRLSPLKSAEQLPC